MRKKAGLREKFNNVKAEDLSDVQMFQKRNNREHFNLTQNFSIYRINIISAGQLWHVWSFSDIRWQVFLHSTRFFHRILRNFAWKTAMKRSKLSNQALY